MDQLAEGEFQRGRRPSAPIRLVRVQSRATSAFPSESRATSGADGVEQ